MSPLKALMEKSGAGKKAEEQASPLHRLSMLTAAANGVGAFQMAARKSRESAEAAALAKKETELVIKVLQKPPSEREDEDLDVVQRKTAGIKFFKGLNDPIQHHEICRVMTYEYVEAEQMICTQGEMGTTYYVIYSGAVKVFVSDGSKNSSLENNGLGANVAVLGDGDAFGELALLGNGLRAASCVTAAPTQFLKVEKADYQSTLQHLDQAKLASRVAFLRRVFLFTEWSDEDLMKLSKVVTQKKYEKNSTIIRQNEHTDQMYFIMSGKCRVLKRMGLSKELQTKLTDCREAGGSPRVSGTPRPALSGGEEPFLEICELTMHQYFGERALLEGPHKGKHSASVVSTTPMEVLLLSKYDFYHHMGPSTIELMRSYADKFYFDEEKIRRTIHKQHRWDAYKRGLVKDVLSPRLAGHQH